MENGLSLLENDLDQVFGKFYEHLLSDKHFAGFFGKDEDVRSLIERQKENFKEALHEGEEQLNTRFVALGVMHHKIAVPYPDFMVGIDYLAEQFFNILTIRIVNHRFDPALVKQRCNFRSGVTRCNYADCHTKNLPMLIGVPLWCGLIGL